MRRPFLLIAALLCLSLACAVAGGLGTAAAATASWRFEPPSYDFGIRLPAEGPTSAAAFTLKNTGEVSISPTLVSVTNGSGSGFALAGNGCKAALAPGASCTIEVSFDPTTGGRKEGKLAVETASPGVPAATAQLLGSGGEPIVVIEPAAVVFDQVPIPVAAAPGGSRRTVTVRNAGSADLTIRDFGFEEAAPTGPRPNFFERVDAGGPGLCSFAVIAPGASCSLNFEFAPLSPGTYSATVTLKDDAADSLQLISLAGTAVAQPPAPPPPITPEATLPKLSRKPPLRTKSRTATFVFSATVSTRGFTCRSGKRQPFVPCTSPVHLRGLKPGWHLFAVRAIGAYATPGPITSYHWRVLG
jgi:hypothetical protein